MKRTIMILLTFILIFTTFIPPHTAYSEEAEGYCESMSFTIQTVRAGDIKIDGEASPDSEIEVEIGEYEDSTTADNNCQFHFDIDEDLLIESETILLKNDQHEIETEVESTDALVETIESDIEGECEIPEEVLKEIEDQNNEQNDEASEEESIDEIVEESDDEEVTEEESEEGTEEADDESGEVTSVDSSEEVVEESEDETESDNEEERTEEENDSEESIEETPTDEEEAVEDETDEVTEEESTESESDTEESGEETSADDEEAAQDEIDEVTEEERIEDENDAEESEEETPADDEEAIEDASDAHSGEKPEESEDKSDESANQDNKEIQEVSAFSLSEIRQQSEAPIQPMQGSAVTVNNAGEFNQALNNQSVEVINLAANINSSGTRNVRSNSGQKVINANGHSIDMGSGKLEIANGVSNFYVRNATNLYTSNSNSDEGFFEKNDVAVNLHLENISFNVNNSPSGGKLGSNWEGEIHFYGNNIVNTINGDNTLAFREVHVHENANLEINHGNAGAALLFHRMRFDYSDAQYGLFVHDNANLNITSNEKVIETDLRFIVVNRELKLRVNDGAEVRMVGAGNEIFDLDSPLSIIIKNPKTVDFQNRANNPLFSRDITLRDNVAFNVQEASIHGWDNNSVWSDPPSYKTPVLDNINFRFDYRSWPSSDSTVVNSMNPHDSNFENEILPSSKRIMFDHSEIHTLDLEVQEISDTDTEITGSTAANAEVTLFDDEGNEMEVTTSNSEGEFTFDFENPFEAGEVLSFQSSYNNRDSNLVERTVVGERLEFTEVPADIPFETTEISDEETIINRANDNLDIEIFSTRAAGDWVLSAQAETALTNDEGLELNNAMYFVEDGEYELLEDEAVEVARGNLTGNEDTYAVSWGPEEGILLRLNPIYASPESEYSTTIEWTLTDGP